MIILSKISDIFETSKGVVIAGINPDLDALDYDNIKKVSIGNKVLLNSKNKTSNIEVIDIQITQSMLDKKNIFLLVTGQISTYTDIIGGKVYDPD